MFNQLKKRGSILTGHNRSNNQKRRQYLLKQRQNIILQQRQMILQREAIRIQQQQLKLNKSDLLQNNVQQLINMNQINSNNHDTKSDIKISIVMAYYNRKSQTIETLKGFEKMYAGKYNIEVVIVDDNSNNEHKLEDDLKQFTFPINLIVISQQEKADRINPCIVFNKGFTASTGDIIVIQNPECYHYTDVISKFINLDFYNNYYSSPVISSPSYTHNDFIKNNRLSSEEMINYLENENLKYPYHYCKGWYNHPQLSSPPESRHLHFCSAIHRNNLDILMGFDENYKNGSWYDDNEFLFRIKKFLNCSFLDSLVIHQFHEVGSAVENNDESLKDKISLNKKLYDELQKTDKNEYITWKSDNCSEINFIKKEKKHGIAISVYSDNLTHEARILKSIKCIKSVVRFFPKLPIFIIIDGSITSMHLNQLQKMKTINENVKIFKLSQNKGISYIKNICINLLKEVCDYMYLLDDDIEIKKNNLDKLIENTFSKNNIPLITNFKHINNNIVIKNGIKYIYLKEGINQSYGNLIVINKWYLSKYGYFYILKHKWGYEHILLTASYLKNTEYYNLGLLDLKEYIYDGDGDEDLHLHCNLNLNYIACKENLIIGKEILKTDKYNLFFKNNLELQEI